MICGKNREALDHGVAVNDYPCDLTDLSNYYNYTSSDKNDNLKKPFKTIGIIDLIEKLIVYYTSINSC